MSRSSDPFLDEVHALKKAASARFGHDIGKMIDYANGLTPLAHRSKVGRSARNGRHGAARKEDPFMDEIHAIKKAVSAAAGHDVRKLAAMANKAAAARRSKRSGGKKSAA